MAGIDFTDKIRNVKAKTLVAVGEGDKANQKAAREMSEMLNCELKIIPKSGHEVNVDEPTALAEMISKFYKKSGLI